MQTIRSCIPISITFSKWYILAVTWYYRKSGEGGLEISHYYFLQLHVYLELSTDKSFTKNNLLCLPTLNPAILLPSIHSRETRDKMQCETCTGMFIPSFFHKSTIWKQPKCLSTDEEINKLWYIRIKYYKAIKKTCNE